MLLVTRLKKWSVSEFEHFICMYGVILSPWINMRLYYNIVKFVDKHMAIFIKIIENY